MLAKNIATILSLEEKKAWVNFEGTNSPKIRTDPPKATAERLALMVNLLSQSLSSDRSSSALRKALAIKLNSAQLNRPIKREKRLVHGCMKIL